MNSKALTFATAAFMLGVVVVAQDRAAQPGHPTQERVWIENRGDAQAVPVTLAAGARVTVSGPVAINGAVTLEPSTTVSTRVSRQAWDYETLAVPANSDALKAAGAQGWEAVGVVSPAPDLVVLMKRPR